jgi:hypothetical protein
MKYEREQEADDAGSHGGGRLALLSELLSPET